MGRLERRVAVAAVLLDAPAAERRVRVRSHHRRVEQVGAEAFGDAVRLEVESPSSSMRRRSRGAAGGTSSSAARRATTACSYQANQELGAARGHVRRQRRPVAGEACRRRVEGCSERPSNTVTTSWFSSVSKRSQRSGPTRGGAHRGLELRPYELLMLAVVVVSHRLGAVGLDAVADVEHVGALAIAVVPIACLVRARVLADAVVEHIRLPGAPRPHGRSRRRRRRPTHTRRSCTAAGTLRRRASPRCS